MILEHLYLREGDYLKAEDCLQTLVYLNNEVFPSDPLFRTSCMNYIFQGSRSDIVGLFSRSIRI